MVLTVETVANFARTAVTNNVIKIRATVFVKAVAGETFVMGHVLRFVIKTRVILIQVIVSVVFLDIME